jgi:outer membrane lipoprotein SlyB
MRVKYLTAVVTGVLFSGISLHSIAVDKKSLNSLIQIDYGVVQKVENVKVDSNVGKGVVAGGVLGAATSGKHDRAKHAAEGAAAVAILTAIAEGKRKAHSYEVKMPSGSIVKIVTESGGIDKGDCVAIEQGQSANIRRVSAVYCEEPDHEVFQHPYVQAAAYEDAAECHAAKEMAMHAKTEKEVDLALKKVRIFCGD